MFGGLFDGAPLCAGLWFWRGWTGLWIRSWPQTGGQTWGDLTVGSRGHLVATDHSSQGSQTSGNCCSSVPLKNADKHGCPSDLKFIFFKYKKTFKTTKKAVSLSLEPVTRRGLILICTLRDQVSLEIWFNWSSSPRTPPPPHPHCHTHTHTHTIWKKLLQLHLQQCAWTEHTSICFIFMPWLFMCAKCTPSNMHARRRMATWLFMHTDGVTRTRPPLTPQPLGFWLHPQRVWLWDRWSQGQGKAAHCFTCPGSARTAQGLSRGTLLSL